MTPDLLRSAGEALFGSQWQGRFSVDFNVNPRTLRRFLSGQDDIPLSMIHEIYTKLRERHDRTAQLLDPRPVDPRDPDYSRQGIFRYHNCSRCQNGARLDRCPTPDAPGNCGQPHARND